MQFASNMMGLYALLVVFIALMSTRTVDSQIHWNRGWGAGGSVGKRSSSALDDIVLSDECQVDLNIAIANIGRLIKNEIAKVAACESFTKFTSDDSLKNQWWAVKTHKN